MPSRNDRRVDGKAEVAEADVGSLALGGVDEEVRPAGGGTPHINEGKPRAHQHAAEARRQQAAALVDGEEGQHKVDDEGADDHGAQAFEEKLAAQRAPGEQHQGHVQRQGDHAHRQGPTDS